MKIKDLFSLALRNLWRRKVRTILTIMGVVIGSTSIIIMLSLGEAQNKQIDKMIKENDLLKSIEVSRKNILTQDMILAGNQQAE